MLGHGDQFYQESAYNKVGFIFSDNIFPGSEIRLRIRF